MDVRKIAKTAFLQEWQRLGGTRTRSITRERPVVESRMLDEELIARIDETFDLDNVQSELLKESRQIVTASERIRSERHHRYNLRLLAKHYARDLYEATDGGANLSPETLAEAQMMLRGSRVCRAYPCKRR